MFSCEFGKISQNPLNRSSQADYFWHLKIIILINASMTSVSTHISVFFNPLSANHTKMAKHTQTIRHQFPVELFECVWPFCGVGAERVKITTL